MVIIKAMDKSTLKSKINYRTIIKVILTLTCPISAIQAMNEIN